MFCIDRMCMSAYTCIDMDNLICMNAYVCIDCKRYAFRINVGSSAISAWKPISVCVPTKKSDQ